MKRILALILSLSLCCGIFTFLPVTAASKEEIKEDIKDLEAESAELEKEIAVLQGQVNAQEKIKNNYVAQINNLQSQINVFQNKINELNNKIKTSKAEIAEKEKTIEETKTLLKQRIRAIYMSGSTNSDLLLLLGSDNFSDFLTSRGLAKSISAKDEAVINEINEAIVTIESSFADIEAAIKEQDEAKAILDEKKAALDSKKAAVNSVIYELSQDKKALERDNKKIEAEINRLAAEINAGMQTNGNQNVVFNGVFGWPVPGHYYVSSEYGQRWGRLHKGLDIAAGGIYGKPIVAAAAGKVLVAGWSTGGYGYYVTINHGYLNGNYYTTLYAHMKQRPSVSAGQTVKKGQVIGYVGSTGDSTGPHCHFEIWENGTPKNPRKFL